MSYGQSPQNAVKRRSLSTVKFYKRQNLQSDDCRGKKKNTCSSVPNCSYRKILGV